MARILSIDFGMKRCGLAVTDPLQIIVSPLTTVAKSELLSYLKNYIASEEVEKVVIGLPVHRDGSFTHLKLEIDKFVEQFKKAFSQIEVDFADEQFTSVEAKEIILKSQVSKKKRRDKSLVDKISATLILQRYLQHY